ncbi:MAG: hydrogenase nickel incorporation protein HypB [Candidatus Aminicenantes bacterium]|nr:hydrogenase nickel incorporation protein HypB [Candidatus Aminicenantes bacterium]NIM78667.1 hydrogenase nickel incorporation protein HypB [Candidatus Aminicenantes bacterium]NIN17914.1 hydrogenase nickel incorporation protein HypB [Candidatus Aminicenantes bacterium]NIN41817.1 hydrogenase nickel incorporation protein HypB [Candidatus Aminicenantes bacterium]NIN84569.1 hydrogenase nickel incorporation protein HypB [Candidatus Aminicenantes bacterium]
MKTKKQLNLSAQETNKLIAAENRKFFSENGIFAVNIIGSPGCGKTSILEYIVNHFDGNFAVIVGDVKTALDSDRIIQSGHKNAYAIETGGGCHLTANMISQTLEEMDIKNMDYLFIENVGNLVCPSSFDLGENLKIAVLSIPEGDEKVRKYPSLFLRAAAVIINKIDLLGLMDYDIKRVKSDCLAHNPNVKIFETSAKTGKGFDQWFQFLKEQRK